MNPRNRNTVSIQWVVLNVIFAVIFSGDVIKTDVMGCLSWQQCLTISECRRVQKMNNLPPDAVMDFSSSVLYPCDDTAYPKICCTVKSPVEPPPEDPGYTITYGEEPKASEPIPEALPLEVEGNQKKRDVLPLTRCGFFKKGNHEENASPGQFPWLALLGSKENNTGDLQFHCGGSLINSRYILTSANCIEKMISKPEIVRLGEYDRSQEKDCRLELLDDCAQDYEVEEVIIHELYNMPFLKNDISLVRLKEAVPEFTDNIQPICLPTETLVSSTFTIAGWGIYDGRYSKISPSMTPKFGNKTFPGQKECESRLAIPAQPVAESQLCLRVSETSCFADAGGPLISFVTTDNVDQAIQVGILSEAGTCNSAFAGELYTKVASFVDWIVKNTSQ